MEKKIFIAICVVLLVIYIVLSVPHTPKLEPLVPIERGQPTSFMPFISSNMTPSGNMSWTPRNDITVILGSNYISGTNTSSVASGTKYYLNKGTITLIDKNGEKLTFEEASNISIRTGK